MDLSVIIPAYNEEKIVDNTLNILYLELKKLNKKFEIIVSDDGSSDSTYNVALNKMKDFTELKVIRNDINKGRGYTLTQAFRSAKGDIQIYVDADLSIHLGLIPTILKEIGNGADIVIGSKHLKDSKVQYPKLRRFFSKSYSFLTRLLLNSKIKDYQCGLKGFKKEVIERVLPLVKNEKWSWDTEILMKAGILGYNIIEIPAIVRNVYGRDSKVSLLRDVRRMGIDLIGLWREKKRFKKSIKNKF